MGDDRVGCFRSAPAWTIVAGISSPSRGGLFRESDHVVDRLVSSPDRGGESGVGLFLLPVGLIRNIDLVYALTSAWRCCDGTSIGRVEMVDHRRRSVRCGWRFLTGRSGLGFSFANDVVEFGDRVWRRCGIVYNEKARRSLLPVPHERGTGKFFCASVQFICGDSLIAGCIAGWCTIAFSELFLAFGVGVDLIAANGGFSCR